MELLSLNEINQLSNSIKEECIKDPFLKAKVDSIKLFELYSIKHKAVNQNQTNIGVIGLNKKTGEVIQFDPSGKYSPVFLMKVKNKEQFLKVLRKYEQKGADVKRIR